MSRETLIAKLKEDIFQGRAVVVAGTGVSVAACGNQKIEGWKVATWVGLLQHGAKHCEDIGAADKADAEILAMQIRSGKTNFLISAAEDISQRMRAKAPGVFLGWLKDTIGKLEVKDRSLVDAVAALPGVLATLNYDNLLEDATGRHAVTWLKSDQVQDVLTRKVTDAVLHLHGWFKEPESVVFGLSSYLAVREHPHAKAVLNLFTMDRTLLFIGCGTTVLDPNFIRLVEWGKAALKEVAPRHYLLCRKAELTHFQEKLDDAPWLQPLDYGADYQDLVPFLRKLVPAGAMLGRAKPSEPASPGFDLAAYRQAMRKRYAGLKLEELDATSHDVRRLLLIDMFIAQSARECADFMPRVFDLPKELQRRLRESGELEGAELDDDVLVKHRGAYFEQSPRPILEVIRDSAAKRLVILGDPGCGKSTLLQYLVLQWAERAAPDLAHEPLPILIELREYARLRHEDRADGFLPYLHAGATARWHLDQWQLDAWLKDNCSLIFFDGLDEVFDPTLRREVSTAIHRFADEYPLSRIIVTSRVIGYQHQTWHDEGFRHFMLQDLDEAQISDFLARWHRHAYEDTARGETKRSLLARGIADSAAIRQLAGNPLLLTMMAILNRTQDLPRDRAELYEQCSRLLLHQWKTDSAFSSYPELVNASLDFKDKRELLLLVARAMQSGERGLGGNLIDASTLESTLRAGLRNIPNVRAGRAARALVEQLHGRNFMLSYVGGNSYAFVHRTFLEYFCAVEIRERFHERTLTKEQLKTEIFGHWADETWREVLCLLAGMIAAPIVAEILEWLLEQPDPGETCEHVFLAARCVGEVRKRAELGAIEKVILNRTKQLTRFDLRYYYNEWGKEAQTVGMVRARAVNLVARVWHDLDDTPSWIRALVQPGPGSGVAYAESDECTSAICELARGWKNDADTLPILKDRAEFDENFGIRSVALEEIALGWKDDPAILPWLKSRAELDKDWWVRESMVRVLSRVWEDDPETLRWLKSRARSDVQSLVCRSAVHEVVRGWKDDSGTLPWLKERVQSDEGWGVRQGSVYELARGWKKDPDVLRIVKASAEPDERSDLVRIVAVRELARGWKHDPETLPILKTRAHSDEDFSVRETAVEELARGWKDDPKILSILKGYALDEDYRLRKSAMQALARHWKDDPDTLRWLKTRAQIDEHFVVGESVVEELARSCRGDPETLRWLKSCAQSAQVAERAVEEVARGWKDDPETLPWLKACAEFGEHRHQRWCAVEKVARGWRDDPATLPWLKALEQSDADFNVRTTVVHELARGWKGDPKTLPWIKVRAQFDPCLHVRQSAIQELARGWKDDPETLPILKTRAQSDEDESVRKTAVEELARGWNEDPETLLILKTREQSDESSAVRKSDGRGLAEG